MRSFFATLAFPSLLGATIGGAYLLTPEREYAAPEQLPGAQHFATVDGFSIHYTDEGPRTGPPVLLIHGFGGATWTWRKERVALADAGFRVIAIDLLGSGASERPTAPIYTTHLQAQLVLGLLNVLGVHSVQLVGHSYGARVALQTAILAPERIRSLALLAPEAFAYKRPPVAQWLKVPALGYALAFYSTTPQLVPTGLKMVSKQHDWMTPSAVAGYAAPLYIRGSAAGQVWQARSPKDGAQPVPDNLASIQQPTLLIWGGDDPVFPAADGQKLASILPHAELHVLPAVGHLPHEEAGEETVKHLLTWLQDTGTQYDRN